jgi:hypothetical protein
MPQVLFRVIKAQQSDFRAFYKEIEKALDTIVKPDLLEYFNKVVKSWKNQPEFKARKIIWLERMQVYVYPAGPDAEIWKYVSFGTRGPYPIPKPGNTKAKTLKFRWGGPGSYKARTTTSGGYDGPGKATGPIVLRKRVMHPGIKARSFEKHIARWYKPKFQRTMNDAVKRGTAAAKRAAR